MRVGLSVIRSKTELRVRQRELKSLALRIARLRRKLMQAAVERDDIERALRPLQDEWGDLKAQIWKYEERSE
jgi:SOS response regulatory protein OraA/RecX